MKRIIGSMLFGLLLLAGLVTPASAQSVGDVARAGKAILPKVAKVVPYADAIIEGIKAIEAATANRSKIMIDVATKSIDPSRKIVVTEEVIDVDRYHKIYWDYYGSVNVSIVVPCKVHYGIELTSVNFKAMRWNEKAKVLFVPMPKVEILSVEPQLDQMSREISYTGFCNSFWHGELARDMEVELLKTNYRQRVNERSIPNAYEIIQKSRESLQQHMEGTLKLAIPGVQVVVE